MKLRINFKSKQYIMIEWDDTFEEFYNQFYRSTIMKKVDGDILDMYIFRVADVESVQPLPML